MVKVVGKVVVGEVEKVVEEKVVMKVVVGGGR